MVNEGHEVGKNRFSKRPGGARSTFRGTQATSRQAICPAAQRIGKAKKFVS